MYQTSYRLYIPDFRLIFMFLTSDKLYECVNLFGHIFDGPTIVYFDKSVCLSVSITMYVCLFLFIFDVIYKYVW